MNGDAYQMVMLVAQSGLSHINVPSSLAKCSFIASNPLEFWGVISPVSA